MEETPFHLQKRNLKSSTQKKTWHKLCHIDKYFLVNYHLRRERFFHFREASILSETLQLKNRSIKQDNEADYTLKSCFKSWRGKIMCSMLFNCYHYSLINLFPWYSKTLIQFCHCHFPVFYRIQTTEESPFEIWYQTLCTEKN